MLKKTQNITCLFCGKGVDQVEKIIEGPSVHICNECVGLCNEVLEEENQQEAFAPSGEPTRLYKKHYNRADTSAECTEAPLLYMPTHPARDLDIDLKVAGIPKLLPGR